jgi:hypothetical protein
MLFLFRFQLIRSISDVVEVLEMQMSLANRTVSVLPPPKPDTLFAVLMSTYGQNTELKAGLADDADTSFLASGFVLQMLKESPLCVECG